ncbi:proliferating cell nuclear antigen [Scaptodrosophila lebanonensis]|uniref:DNA sliding clamp PCNA n=1 Tax=Drosophila lebanonensis TaxID=7225 RepID=A0A6J2TK42_DROLE|nr:proliferating cell nuclear antigen [Scaptodrosophila lebanonensis]
MFEARLGKTALLKKIVEALKDILKASTLDCSDSGIQLQAMDDSHVSLVELSLSSEGFEKYRCDRNLSLGLHLDMLAKVLKCANNDDAVTISAQDKPDKVLFAFESQSKERTSDYELRLMNLEQEHLGIPDTSYACVVRMPAVEFARICRDLAMFSETVIIACQKDSIKFSASGDAGTANIKLSQSVIDEETQRVSIEVDEPVTLSFGGRYLSSFTRATPLSEQVKIGMAVNVPLLVEYAIENFGYVRYYLAPKVDEPEA